ncbi:hypothetical protein LIER_27749 [Lithospermum erythrorhizon]|uniref:FLZ-type domain-containing protein n=1 Tax=Lithospermum erythrorhizon TaxID=34254 RepID=A0AAV3RGS5_LITER
MLRKVSNTTTSKQALMADYGSLQSPISASILGSPRLFSSFVPKSCPDSESMMSPTSILDSKSSSFINPFWSDSNSCKSPKQESKIVWDKLGCRGVGLGLVDALIQENSDAKIVKSDSKNVLFGSQLKIQIPPLTPPGVESPKSPPEFGIKTRRNCHVGPFSPLPSPSRSKKSLVCSSNSSMNLPRVVSSLSASEMELSEEYTCVIYHGPNPKTTHIFDDCIVESCCGVSKFSESRKGNPFSGDCFMSFPSKNFLSFCHYCKKTLDQGNEIYMYRGEKAFCSSDCRYHEIELDEGIETPEFDDLYGTPP